ncbi:MAG: hypothetical protein Aurels2KO_45870 [Aureliella sp.]
MDNTRISVRSILALITSIAACTAIWSLNHRFKSAQRINEELQREIQLARDGVVHHAQDPIAVAIRALADKDDQYLREIRILAANWGMIERNGLHPSIQLRDAGKAPYSVDVFEGRAESTSTNQCIVIILFDDARRVVDAIAYESDHERETHRLIRRGPLEWTVATYDLAGKRKSIEHWTMNREGFSRADRRSPDGS